MLEMYSRLAALDVGTLKSPFSSQATELFPERPQGGLTLWKICLMFGQKFRGSLRKAYKAFSLWSSPSPSILLCIYYCPFQLTIQLSLGALSFPGFWKLPQAEAWIYVELSPWISLLLRIRALCEFLLRPENRSFIHFVHFYNSFQWEVSLIIMTPSWEVSGLSLHYTFQLMINYLNGHSYAHG